MSAAMSEGKETELAVSSGSLCTVEPPQVAAVRSLQAGYLNLVVLTSIGLPTFEKQLRGPG